jgi:phosphoglycolate phosphatase-like HAD superfamily hydrolase
VVAAGDATSGMLAARRAGAGLTVGVLSGAHRAGPLRAAGADALIDSVADLPALLGLPS